MAKAFLEFDAGEFFRNIKRDFTNKVRVKIKPLILKNIRSGRSPVRSYGRYQDYSPSYKKRIKSGYYTQYNKKLRPINLTLSGRMLKMLAVREGKNGVTVYNTNELAKYHNDEGAGRSRVIRKMLPGNNEQFITSISNEIENQLERSIEKALKK